MKPRSPIPLFARTLLRSVIVLVAMAALATCPVARSAARVLALRAPALVPFEGKSHTDSYLLKGEIDSVRVKSWVRILRDGVQVDSASGATDTLISRRVPLQLGTNTFTAVLRDSNFATSPPSNAVIVHFDGKAGLFMPVPMVAGASFDLNAIDAAVKAELRIFDTAGDLVVRFENHESRTFYSFPWDGKNASQQSVRRGPLVAVGAIDYPDGTHDVIRQVFLFDPEAAP